jgi:hypothetical protein
MIVLVLDKRIVNIRDTARASGGTAMQVECGCASAYGKRRVEGLTKLNESAGTARGNGG